MTKQDILEFINANLSCHLATVSDNQPHVRGMAAYRATEDGIIFHTAKAKDLYQQIVKNPLVEICFFSQEKFIQIRVTGKVVMKDDLALKQEIVAARQFLKPWIDQTGYDSMAVFEVVNCMAHVWTFDRNLLPKEYIQITN